MIEMTRYLSVTEAPHNTNFHTWMGKKHFCFFQTAETGNRTPNSGVKGSGANHYPRAPALNMEKPAATKNRLNMHCCRIHQIDIPSAQILFSKYTISSKALAEMVLLSNNSI